MESKKFEKMYNYETREQLKKKKEDLSLKTWEKIKTRFEEFKKNHKKKKLVILFCGGSYNPVHKMHIELFQQGKNHLDKHSNLYILAGFLVPTRKKKMILLKFSN